MKKIFGILFLLVGVILLFLFFRQKSNTQKLVVSDKSNVTPATIQSKTLFVPYWTTSIIESGYDKYVYFGITPTGGGIDTKEDGYKDLASFVEKTQGKQTLLAVRILTTNVVQKLLDDTTLTEKVISQSIHIAKDNGFDGIVLDLEYSGLGFPSVTKDLTDFSVQFAQKVKGSNLLYYQLLYGDTFYLARPFNVGVIAKASDGIFVMSYDFHKANGTPGPNFPLVRLPDADYSFIEMLTDFTRVAPREKLTILFGMFGYDWIIDEKGRPKTTAKSLSTGELQQLCKQKNCQTIRDVKTQEPSFTYTDEKGEKHVVWYEDVPSVEKKKSVVEEQGIGSIGFWANSYF